MLCERALALRAATAGIVKLAVRTVRAQRQRDRHGEVALVGISWKLSEAQKRELVRRYRAGERVHVIAAHFGVSSSAVSMTAIRRGVRRRKRSNGGTE